MKPQYWNFHVVKFVLLCLHGVGDTHEIFNGIHSMNVKPCVQNALRVVIIEERVMLPT